MSNLSAVHERRVITRKPEADIPRMLRTYIITTDALENPYPRVPSLRHYLQSALVGERGDLLDGYGELGKLVSFGPNGDVYAATFILPDGHPSESDAGEESLISQTLYVTAEVVDHLVNTGVLMEAENLCFGRMKDGVLESIVAYALAA